MPGLGRIREYDGKRSGTAGAAKAKRDGMGRGVVLTPNKFFCKAQIGNTEAQPENPFHP